MTKERCGKEEKWMKNVVKAVGYLIYYVFIM